MQWILVLLSLMGQCSFFTCRHYDYHFIKENKTWDEAQKYCRENYTDLATVSNMTDMKRLINSIESQDEAWIGLHSYPGNGSRKWHWSLPGVEFNESETRWESGEPNDYNGHLENCALMTNKNWSDFPCTASFKFICYNDKVILVNERKTWVEALNYCRKYHHDLVSITNPHEQRWVQERAKDANSPLVWLGLRYSCTLDFWFWVSDKRFSYSNWASKVTDGCDMSAAMETGGQNQWVKTNDNETYNFICF
ncbi:Macrophage mannose receptor 1 [Channa argus]|uniref:Macrophage mannose receptor 1 n=1 Tax=Channa argus TaxID=215402 RepID=A0A6G1Q562_CHAAH|nr:Macrophage mannose receptor 1 [Channa argus]